MDGVSSLPYRVNHIHVNVTIPISINPCQDLADDIKHYIEVQTFLHHCVHMAHVVEKFRLLAATIVCDSPCDAPYDATDIQLEPNQILQCDSVTFTVGT